MEPDLPRRADDCCTVGPADPPLSHFRDEWRELPLSRVDEIQEEPEIGVKTKLPFLPRTAIFKTGVGQFCALRVGQSCALSSSRAHRAGRNPPRSVNQFRKTRCTSQAPSPPSTPASTSWSLSPGASALRGRQVPRRLCTLWLPGSLLGAVPVTVDPSCYRLNRDFSASGSPPQVAVEHVDDLPRRTQAAAFEDPNDPGTQPHFPDRTKRVVGLVQQGMITRVIKGFIFEMAIVQRLADPPCQRMDCFRLAGSGVTPHVRARPRRELARRGMGEHRSRRVPQRTVQPGIPLARLRPRNLPGRDLIRRVQPTVRKQFVHGAKPSDITDLPQPRDHRLRSHAGNALEVRSELAAGSRPPLADPPGQVICLFYTQVLNHFDFLIECVDPFPPLIEHSNHPRWDSGIGEVIAVNGHGTVCTEVLDQRTNDEPVDLPQLPDHMTKAEQIAVDPVRQPTSLRHQFATLIRQHPQFLNLVRSHPRLAPQAVQAVLRELFRVQAIGLSADMAGVRRIDDRRPPSPGQAEGHVVLAGRLTGVTEVRWGQFDAMLLQSAQISLFDPSGLEIP